MTKRSWIMILCIFTSVFGSMSFGGGGSLASAPKWLARYNGPGNGSDEARAIAIDNSGNVYVTGEIVISDDTDDSDYATIKYNSKGQQLWIQRYNGPGNRIDSGNAVAVDRSGYVYVTGDSEVSDDINDYATIKYDTNGVQLWAARYNGPGNFVDRARAVAVDGLGNVYVTGESYSSRTKENIATVKYSPSGKQLWVRTYSGSAKSFNSAIAVAVDSSNNVCVAGITNFTATDYALVAIKYDTNGKQIWINKYAGPNIVIAMALDNSGNVYITGNSYGAGAPSFITIKFSSKGKTLWVINRSNISAGALAVDKSGNVYIAGESHLSGVTYFNTIKYSTRGQLIWEKTYKLTRFGYIHALAVDPSGNVFIAAESTGQGTDSDYTTIKYDKNGKTIWVKRYNGPGNGDDSPSAIAVDASGYAYITGRSVGSGTDNDYATIKY
jgi:hypothetical protein